MKNDDPADAELQARFAALRSHDEAQAPPFAAPQAYAASGPAPVRPRPTWHFGLAGCALLVVLLLPLYRAHLPHTQGTQAQQATQAEADPAVPLQPWRAPTDGLLQPAPLHVTSLAWDSLPTTSLGRPTFSRYPEDRR